MNLSVLIIAAACGAAAAGTGIFLVFLDLFRLPTRRASINLTRAARRSRVKLSPPRLEVALAGLSAAIASKIRIGRAKKESIEKTLRAADLKISAEAHIADCVVRAAVVGVFALPAGLIFPAAAPAVLAAAFGIYADGRMRPSRLVAARREAIEFELPMLVSRIDSMLRSTRDIVAILNSYRKSAGPELESELSVTVADMQSGSIHAALTRLEARVGSASLSDVVRGLSAVVDGNDPVGYWAALFTRLTDNRRQLLTRFAKKIPSKIAVLSFCLLASTFLLYLVVIGGEVMRSLGVLFG